MRSKSIINVKKNLADEIIAGVHSYGAILTETYWRETKDGFLIQSTPTTSEILDGWFYPFKLTIKNNRVYINRWFTSIRLEELTEADGIHVERLVFKPDLDTEAAPADFISGKCWANFREYWGDND